jgi:choline dehydrogenase-like flavoprotein
MVTRVATDERTGLATGVHYVRDGRERFQKARMAADEQHGVVDRNCRSFAVPNLYLTDGSVLPTQGSANPALTIMAVAARAADQLASGSAASA